MANDTASIQLIHRSERAGS